VDPRHPKKGTALTELPPSEVTERELAKGRAPLERRPARAVPSRHATASDRAMIEALHPGTLRARTRRIGARHR
jgi:hypothetical protein